MKAIADAIMTKYNAATTLKAANTGGLWLEEVPQKTAFPYTTFHFISGRPEYTFTENMESFTIQFNIWSDSKSSATVLDIFDKLIAVFDWCSLTITGYTSIYMERISNNLMKNEDNTVWQQTVIYNVEAKKN